MSVYQITEVGLPFGPVTFPAIGYTAGYKISPVELASNPIRDWLVSPTAVIQVFHHWEILAWQIGHMVCRDHNRVRLLLIMLLLQPVEHLLALWKLSAGKRCLAWFFSVLQQKCVVSSAIWYRHLVTVNNQELVLFGGSCGAPPGQQLPESYPMPDTGISV